MDESEKLTALKKAYAEIILNTAKEAAARIMVSERKSFRYQRELSTAKEGALQMLVRLKHMMDSTVSEAEKTSLSQRKKIEELEAQLEEAEDIVKDLREELQQIQDELEKVTNNKLPAAREQNLVCSNACQRDITPEDGLNTTGSMSPFPCPEPEPVLTHEIHSTLRDTTPEDGLITTESISPLPCSKPETVSTYEIPSTLNNGYLHDSDFASVRRSKEPELYRNGCTQRIRAFERNTFDESLSFSAKDDIKSGIINRGDEEAKELQLTQSHISDNMSEDGKKVDIPTGALMDCSNMRAPVLKPCRRKRKREVKYIKGKAPSIIYLPDIPKADPYCSDSFSADVVDWSGNISSKINKNGEKDILFSADGNDALETADIMTSLGVDAMESDEAFVKPCNALIMTDYKKEVLDKPDLICKDSLSLDSSYGQGCKTDVETVKDLLVSPDKKESDINDEIPIESPGTKLLKYTFRRKRKKEHLNSPNGSSSLDECVPDKEIRENQSTPLGSQKSSSMTESPRENRQLAHVARQALLCLGSSFVFLRRNGESRNHGISIQRRQSKINKTRPNVDSIKSSSELRRTSRR